jgi:uncharacterized protein (TIGR02231 family)
MNRFLMTTALICAAPAAWADDIVLRADIEAATVYGTGAEVLRQATLTIPAGTHDLFIAMPDARWSDLIQVTATGGVTVTPAQFAPDMDLPEAALDTEAQAAARAAVDAAEDAVLAIQDEIALADADVAAIEAQLGYLNALTRGGEDGASMPEDPARIAQVLATLGGEMGRVTSELAATRAARRDLNDRLQDGTTALAAAQADLALQRPFGTKEDGLRLQITAEAETETVLSVTYLSGEATWFPSYDLRLATDSGQMTLDRFITLQVSDVARWNDVDVVFSTANPSRQRVPRDVMSTPVRLVPEQAQTRDMVLGTAAEIAPAPLVLMEDRTAQVLVDGLSLSYAYQAPVSVGDSGEVLLPFDGIDFAMETENRAAPRHDSTAFLIAMGDNDSGEPILPGEARFYRDGALVGQDYLPLIAQGAEMELAFGPLDHLRLIWIDRSLAEGDRGVFVSSNTQDRQIAFGVENLGDTAETVRLIYATPFAEQEDLDLDLTLSPQPDQRDIDDRRGVQGWTLDVAPGETVLIDMDLSLTWPEGQVLIWRP